MLEYQIIKDYYGTRTAQRSGVPLINHIDEGVEILRMIDASENTIRAYCLHPILQNDTDLRNNRELVKNVNYEVLILTMEYRKTANAYLSYRTIKSIDEIELSPLDEVNQMLWADKLQNKKDFMKYHFGKHHRSSELDLYFNNWVQRLEPIILKHVGS